MMGEGLDVPDWDHFQARFLSTGPTPSGPSSSRSGAPQRPHSWSTNGYRALSFRAVDCSFPEDSWPSNPRIADSRWPVVIEVSGVRGGSGWAACVVPAAPSEHLSVRVQAADRVPHSPLPDPGQADVRGVSGERPLRVDRPGAADGYPGLPAAAVPAVSRRSWRESIYRGGVRPTDGRQPARRSVDEVLRPPNVRGHTSPVEDIN